MSKDKSSVTIQIEHGKMQVTYEAKNDDFISQCQEKWKNSKKNTDSKKDEEEESHAPSVSMKFSWSTDD